MSYQCGKCAGFSTASWRELHHGDACTWRGQQLVVTSVVGVGTSDPLYTMGIPNLDAAAGASQLRGFAETIKREAALAIDHVVEAYERALGGGR